jgi:hypothetical protein
MKDMNIAEAISESLNDKKHLKKISSMIKEFCDGEEVNDNPLKEIPEHEMKIYHIGDKYFDTKEELEKFCNDANIPIEHASVMRYFRSLAGRKDVIGISKQDGSTNFYTVVDGDGYGIYNNSRSIYRGEYIWEYNYGGIESMYNAFRNRGIIFENDIYLKISSRNQYILKRMQEESKFNII